MFSTSNKLIIFRCSLLFCSRKRFNDARVTASRWRRRLWTARGTTCELPSWSPLHLHLEMVLKEAKKSQGQSLDGKVRWSRMSLYWSCWSLSWVWSLMCGLGCRVEGWPLRLVDHGFARGRTFCRLSTYRAILSLNSACAEPGTYRAQETGITLYSTLVAKATVRCLQFLHSNSIINHLACICLKQTHSLIDYSLRTPETKI